MIPSLGLTGKSTKTLNKSRMSIVWVRSGSRNKRYGIIASPCHCWSRRSLQTRHGKIGEPQASKGRVYDVWNYEVAYNPSEVFYMMNIKGIV